MMAQAVGVAEAQAPREADGPREAHAPREADVPSDPGGQTFSALAQALREREDWQERAAAATALGLFGAPAVESLVGALEDEHPRVRLAAGAALEQIGEPAVPRLHLLLRDRSRKDAAERQAAAAALGRIGGPAVPSLIAAWKERDRRHRGVTKAVALALGRAGDERAVGPLVDSLRDRSLDVRRWAAQALGGIRDAAAVPVLVALLHDPVSSVREAASAALVRTGEGAVPALIGTLHQPYFRPRRLAAGALGRIGDVRGVGPLIHALDETRGDLRPAAAQALGEFAARRPVAELRAALPPLRRLAGQSGDGQVTERDRHGADLAQHPAIKAVAAAPPSLSAAILPVPASLPHTSPDGLPIPAALVQEESRRGRVQRVLLAVRACRQRLCCVLRRRAGRDKEGKP